MTDVPPRRSRSLWAVVWQSAITVGLLAMTAWPERHVVVWTQHRCASTRTIVEYTTETTLRVVRCMADVGYPCRSDGQKIKFAAPGLDVVRTFETTPGSDGWSHGFARDAGFQVLIAGLLE